MRRTLLRLLKVKEFAPESQFRAPCSGFTLPDVICTSCQFRYASQVVSASDASTCRLLLF